MEYYKAYRFEKFILSTIDISDFELSNFESSSEKFLLSTDEQKAIRFDGKNFYLYEWVEYNVFGTHANRLTVNDNFFSGKYNRHNAGIILLKNFVGLIKFRDQIFQVESKKMRSSDIEELISDIDNRISETISLAFKSGAISKGEFRKEVNLTRDYYIYKKLYNSMKQGRIIPFFQYIRKKPNIMFEKTMETKEISLINNLSLESIIDVISGDNRLSKELKPNKISKKFKGYAPLEVNEYNNVISVNTSENQFVKYFLDYLSKLLSHYIEDLIKISLDKKQNSVNQLLIDEVIKMREEVRKELSLPFYKQISQMTTLNRSSTTLTKSYGYKQLYNEFVQLRQSPMSFFNSKSLIELFENKSIDKLYEYICLFRLVDILSNLYGPLDPTTSKFSITEKNYTLSISEDNDGVEFFFAENGVLPNSTLKFQHSFSRSNKNSSSISVEFRPDFTLMISDLSRKEYYHFDSKFRVAGDNSSKNDDIAKMHSYRDAINFTRGAFVLFPGENAEVYCMPGNNNYEGVGAFPLNIDHLYDVDLEKMIQDVLLYFLEKGKESVLVSR